MNENETTKFQVFESFAKVIHKLACCWCKNIRLQPRNKSSFQKSEISNSFLCWISKINEKVNRKVVVKIPKFFVALLVYRQKNRVSDQKKNNLIKVGVEPAMVAEWIRVCVKLKQTLTQRPGIKFPLGIMILNTQSEKWLVTIQIVGRRVTVMLSRLRRSIELYLGIRKPN